MSFQDAPWEFVLKRVAKDAGLALQIEQIPPGTFTYVDPRPHSLPETFDLLNGYLFSSGYLLIRNQGLLAIHKLEAGVPPHFIPLVSPFDLQQYGRNEYLTMEVLLNTMDPIAAAQEAQGLLSPMGRVVPLPLSGRIVVTDFGGNLRQLFDMLWARENDPAFQPQVVFHLKNVPAVEVARAINEYLMSQRAPNEGLAVIVPAGAPPGPGGARPMVAAVAGAAIVVPEPTTNCVLVGASHRQMQRIREIIASLDCVPPQVLIQALLVEVDLDNVDEFGVELGVQDSVLFDRSVVDKVVTVTETISNPGNGLQTTNQKILSQTSEPGFNFNNQPLGNNTSASPSTVGTQGLSNFAVGRVNGDLGYGGAVISAGSESVSVLIRALAEKRKVDILSRPQIRTLDNREAEIQIGQQVPVVDGVSLTPVGSANPVIRQDQAGIILRVLPRVSPNDEVVIDVSAEKSEFRTAPGSGIPIFTDATNGNVIEAPIKDVARAKTMVSCMAGQTIILGGMITKGHSVVERKVPVLGDLPLLGRLFRYDYEKTARKELLIFLTPYILRYPAASDAHMETEISRMQFPMNDAMQIHGPNPASPEPIEPRGIDFDKHPIRDFFHGRSATDESAAVQPLPSEEPTPMPQPSAPRYPLPADPYYPIQPAQPNIQPPTQAPLNSPQTTPTANYPGSVPGSQKVWRSRNVSNAGIF